MIGLIMLFVLTNQLEAELKVEGKPKDLRKISGTAEFDGISYYVCIIAQEYSTNCACESTTTDLHVGETFCDATKVKLH